MSEMHDPFEDQVACARYRAERDALAQRMEEVASEINRTLLGGEGIEDAPAMRWARGLREALGALHSPRTSYEDIEAARWVREHGGLDEVKRHYFAACALSGDLAEWKREVYELCEYIGVSHEDCDGEAEMLREAYKVLDKRLMPVGMEWLLDVWPKWSNGEYCKFGDWWKAEMYGKFEPQQFSKLSIYTPEQLREWGQDDGDNYGYEWDFMRPSSTKYRPDKAEPPTPKVLDADGVEIRVGDEVWDKSSGDRLTVGAIEDGGHTIMCRYADIEGSAIPTHGSWSPCDLTHRSPVIAADGRPLREGETVYRIGRTQHRFVVRAASDYEEDEPDGRFCIPCIDKDDGDEECWCDPSQLTHTRPVPGADGKNLLRGETVYNVVDGEECRVLGFSDCTLDVNVMGEDGSFKAVCHDVLTHTKPEIDTWERLEDDAEAIWTKPIGYGKSAKSTITCRAVDLVRRAKKLAERDAR